jgi:hypothetical protein
MSAKQEEQDALCFKLDEANTEIAALRASLAKMTEYAEDMELVQIHSHAIAKGSR